MKMKQQATTLFGVLLAAFADCAISKGAKYDYVPKPVVGYPAGLVPNCPGVMKNVTIHPHNLQNLQLLIHRVGQNGQIYRNSVPMMSAAKTVAKEKSIDLKNKKTIVYAVGFLDSSLFPHSLAIGTTLVKLGYNVFISETFAFLTQIYPKSVRISRVLGLKIGEFLVKLHDQGLRAENLELVGVSLGAHIISYAAKHFYLVTGEKPSRLSGLDPAGPCYRNLPAEYKLDKSDAVKVDVLHTNIDGFGIAEPLGHVDFYANGGEFQPSDIPYIPCLVICSHIRSVIYYWQALQHTKGFIGVKCDSVQDARFANCYNGTVTNYLGPHTNFNKPGIYYLPTNNEFPYYRGKEGLKAENEIYTSVSTSINAEDDIVV